MAVATDDVTKLWKASLALGLAYGSLFGLFPTLTFEWFGMRKSNRSFNCLNHTDLGISIIKAHFSENWGFLSLSPMFGGNIFSIAFGRNLDAHSSTERLTHKLNLSRADTPLEPQCLSGRSCYVTSLYITVAACCFALVLSVWVGWRDRQRTVSSEFRGKVAPEVLFEEGEEE